MFDDFESRVVLLLVLTDGAVLNGLLAPAHVPDRIIAVDALPATHNGKLSEVAARNPVNDLPIGNTAALLNPECIEAIRRHPALNLATREVPPVGGAASNWRRICRRNGLRFSKARTLGCPLILLTRSLCPLTRLLRLYSMALCASLLRPSASPCVDVGLRGVVLRLDMRVAKCRRRSDQRHQHGRSERHAAFPDCFAVEEIEVSGDTINGAVFVH
jgi:hypothetical protein